MRVLTLALIAVLTLVSGAAAENGRGEPKPLLLYVSAWNCAPCHAWERDALPALEASAVWGRIDFRKVSTPQYQRIDEDGYWPAELRWVRDSLGLTRGTPRFVLVRRGEIVASGYASRGWREVHARLREVAGAGS